MENFKYLVKVDAASMLNVQRQIEQLNDDMEYASLSDSRAHYERLKAERDQLALALGAWFSQKMAQQWKKERAASEAMIRSWEKK